MSDSKDKKTKLNEQDSTSQQKQNEFFDNLGSSLQKVSANEGLKADKKSRIVTFKNIDQAQEGIITKPRDELLKEARINTKIKGRITLPNKLTIIRLFLAIPFIVLLAIPLHLPYIKDSTGFTQLSIVPTYFPDASFGGQDGFYALRISCFMAATAIFIIAMITDWLDGKIARRNKIITTFGQVFDPIADKAITTTALIFLSLYGILPFWITIIIVVRDLIIDGLRILASKNNVVVPANKIGKLKTIFTTIGIIVLFFVAPIWNQTSIFDATFSPTFPSIFGGTQNFAGYVIYSSSNFYWIANYFVILPMILATIFSIISGIQYYNAVHKFIELRHLN